MAILYKTNGQQIGVEPANGSHFTLPELQKFVDGYIERLFFRSEAKNSRRIHIHVFILNEEGRLKNLPENVAASVLFMKHNPGPGIVSLYGDILVCRDKNGQFI